MATHNGAFHCDEVLACGLLLHTLEFSNGVIIRTRDPDFISKAHITVDVGGVYNEEKKRFDHHQSEFKDTMTTSHRRYHTRLSSAGLIYKHFGMEVV